jgi:glycosyltransferase involved in cell wall biosynthesis
MSAPNVVGATSVIIPCWNQLEYTRQCVSALLRHTRPPWELIVIDNGSTDGTAAYLADLRDTAPFPVTVIANAKNLGFPAAINQGLECARGEYLVLLNNDVVVTDGWVEQLVGLVSIRGGTTENNGGENHIRVCTTESTEDTEFEEGKGGQFREVKDAYLGRNITVIDLGWRSPVHNLKSGIENETVARKLG